LKIKAYEDAIPCGKAVLAINDKHKAALKIVGKAYYGLDRFSDAADYFARVVEVAPSADHLSDLADALLASGDTGRALKTIQQSLMMDPRHAKALALRALALSPTKVKNAIKTRNMTTEGVPIKKKFTG